ncbi:MAG TPA: hypothetical protein VFJ30_17650 [Phycisphaerae bacterium]|nr:hypothetical protein [Phycisphaerae bacterium]
MKQFILVALICLNAALIVALVAGPPTPKAYGQVMGSNYLVVSGRVDGDTEAVYMIDLSNRRLAGLIMTREGPKAIGPVGGRDLMRDFGRTGNR